jgi:hypothetical protein
MAAIDNLESAVAANTVAVDAAVAKIDVLVAGQGTVGEDPVRVQAAADVVAADAARLSAKSV